MIVELHVDDFEKVKKYYQELDFEVVWERQPEDEKGYLVMKMEDNILSFWCGTKKVYDQIYFKQFPVNTPHGYGVEIILMVSDMDSYYEKVKDFVDVVEPLKLQPWGLKDFRIADPYGYYLRINNKHNILDKSFAVK